MDEQSTVQRKEQIKRGFDAVREQIAEAIAKAGRQEGSVKLCAVSKFHPPEDVAWASECGQKLFGENRIQEAASKAEELSSLGVQGLELHIIGHLQSNKVAKALKIATCIQSVDRTSLLGEIEKQCAKLQKSVSVFFELRTAEESKTGFESTDDVLQAAELFAAGSYPHITPAGLMTMAPFTDDELLIRRSFCLLRTLRESLNTHFPTLPIVELSMGMSGDFPIAIEEGSTMVRVGTALFGQRTP